MMISVEANAGESRQKQVAVETIAPKGSAAEKTLTRRHSLLAQLVRAPH